MRLMLGPTHVKCRLLIYSIFHAMNFQHFLEVAAFPKNATNQKSTFDLRWASYVFMSIGHIKISKCPLWCLYQKINMAMFLLLSSELAISENSQFLAFYLGNKKL